MKNIIAKLKQIPLRGWICGIVFFGLQYGTYRLADWLSRVCGTINYAYVPKIPCIDDNIPLIPIFAVIYLFSYVFWICGPIAASLTKKENFVNYLVGYSGALLIGFFILFLGPTYMDRAAEGLIEAANQPGFSGFLLNMIYGADGADVAFNLFPSFHCMISLYCYLAIRKQPEISRGFKMYNIIMVMLICASTVYTKQHYFIDIPAGLLLAVICYVITNKINPYQRWLKHKEKKLAVSK